MDKIIELQLVLQQQNDINIEAKIKNKLNEKLKKIIIAESYIYDDIKDNDIAINCLVELGVDPNLKYLSTFRVKPESLLATATSRHM